MELDHGRVRDQDVFERVESILEVVKDEAKLGEGVTQAVQAADAAGHQQLHQVPALTEGGARLVSESPDHGCLLAADCRPEGRPHLPESYPSPVHSTCHARGTDRAGRPGRPESIWPVV